MDRLKRARGNIRRSVTKIVNSVDLEIQNEDPDLDELRVTLQRIQIVMPELKDLDTKVMDMMLDNEEEDDVMDEELSSVEEYEKKLLSVKNKIERLIEPSSPSHYSSVGSPKSTRTSGESRRYKLPKIEMKKFDGDLKEWLGFWAQFQKIDEDEELHDTDKFQYLLQCMVPKSRACELVESFPQSADNYPKVVKALKERFGKDKLLKQVYVRELLKLVIENNTKSQEKKLSSMFTKLECHLRALETLGVTGDQTATFLFPMVESSLPEEILIAWQRSPYNGKEGSDEESSKNELDHLMSFLKQEVESEEQRSLARSGFGVTSGEKKKKMFKEIPTEDLPTATGLFSGQGPLCIFCEKVGHESHNCYKAQLMSLEKKKGAVQHNKACFVCLKTGHGSKKCKAPIKCLICGKRHQTVMCEGAIGNKVQQSKSDVPSEQAQSTVSNLNCTQAVMLQTVIAKILYQGRERKVRILFDNGSQRSYVLKKTAAMLGLESTSEVNLCHILFGCSKESRIHKKYQVELSSLNGNGRRLVTLLDHDRVCENIPSMKKGPWLNELKKLGIWLSDLGSSNVEIEVLIGNDIYGSLLTGRVHQLQNGLTAIETNWGWTVSGELSTSDCDDSSVAMHVTSMKMSSYSVTQLWDLETIGIRDPVEVESQIEHEVSAKKKFQETVTRTEDGRYTVSLPWISGTQKIPSNKDVAEKRLEGLTKKLKSLKMYPNYEEIFKSWLAEGIIEEVSEDNGEHCHYIPHHAVIKPESLTTPIRPVFDASCKSGRVPSLNDCLEKGPNMLELIPSVLVRFRLGKIGVTSDIRKAFLMINVAEDDQDYLRFLWWEDPDKRKIKTFRHKRVVFGMNCSPFLLAAVIELHLSRVSPCDKKVAEQLLKSMYVDNCVTSVETLDEYEKFKETATKIMAEAKMELRQWVRTTQGSGIGLHSECGLERSSMDYEARKTPVLGLKWDRVDDTLRCDFKYDQTKEKITKRSVLSTVQSIFDPIGFLCPVTLVPKMMLQEVWTQSLGWDDELPPVISSKFVKWSKDLQKLNEIKIPRNVTGGVSQPGSWQLHCFSDASKAAYAAVVYLRTVSEEGISVQLVGAKSRVAPMKKVTIPRLELMGCVIGSRLTDSIKESLNTSEIPTFYWTDSSTALAWIQRNDDWGTFVGNRVRDILKLTQSSSWRFVPGIMNPADLPSRGCSSSELLDSKWWEGPEWLKSQQEWPRVTVEPDEDIVASERKKSTVASAKCSLIEIPWYVKRFSSYKKNVRVMGWIKRFIENAKVKKCERSFGEISVEEFEKAEVTLFKMVQNEVFPKDQNMISGLQVQRDDEGVIRVKTKMMYRDDTMGFRLPILLPNQHPLIDQLIRDTHLNNMHAGTQFLMGKLRETVWIIQGRRAISKIVTKCTRCRRFTTKNPVSVPAPLPEDRVKTTRVFEVTGVDLAGPLYLRNREKAWIVIFTCAVYRAVHLELVTSLSTQAFLLSLRRFINRRGRPKTIYSDNGTNFTGTENMFKELDWKRIETECQVQKMNWKFNPPSAPWWGGWWERLIRSVKDLLRRVLGRATLTYEELLTCICDAESIINNRPLTWVTEDQDDLIPLTPAMFLQETTEVQVPEMEETGLGKRLEHLTRVREALKSRFRKEYLALSVQKGTGKGGRRINVGDIVLIGSDNMKRMDWPLGKVIELLPGKDNEVRVFKLKTSKGILIRAIQRLYPLEISEDSVPVVENHQDGSKEEESVVVTRSGRKVVKPIRFGY